MANTRLSMRKIKEVLRLTHDGKSEHAPSGAELKHQPQHRQRLSGTSSKSRACLALARDSQRRGVGAETVSAASSRRSRQPKRCRILITSTGS